MYLSCTWTQCATYNGETDEIWERMDTTQMVILSPPACQALGHAPAEASTDSTDSDPQEMGLRASSPPRANNTLLKLISQDCHLCQVDFVAQIQRAVQTEACFGSTIRPLFPEKMPDAQEENLANM